MGIGALYYALKASAELPHDNELRKGLYGIISWIVFTSTIAHGITLPTFLLGSTVHKALHPKFLIRAGDEGREDEEEETGELPETTERVGLLRPLHDVLVRYGAVNEDSNERQPPRPPQRGPDTDRGNSITRKKLHRILTEHAHALEDDQLDGGRSTKRGGQGTLSDDQKRILLGEGSGLEHWDQDEVVQIYDEGDVLILTTDDGG
jgi:hypothetical protein